MESKKEATSGYNQLLLENVDLVHKMYHLVQNGCMTPEEQQEYEKLNAVFRKYLEKVEAIKCDAGVKHSEFLIGSSRVPCM